jgi:hypothetical protein
MTTTIETNFAAMTVAELMEAMAHEQAFRAEQQARIANLTETQAIAGSMTRTNEIQKALQAALKDAPGVLDTDHGKVGYQERRTVTHQAAAVRELAPDLAALVITETVDKKALETMAKAAIKAGKAPETLLADLEARADVKVSNAWICQISAAN